MKNTFHSLFLVLCFTLGLSITVDAQVVRNNTACTFLVIVQYGNGNCGDAQNNFITLNVPPFSQINIGVPQGQSITRAKGAYTQNGVLSCPFYVGIPCSGYDLTTEVECPDLCGSYTVQLDPDRGILISN